MVLLVQGERPSRPTHPTFTDNLWSLVKLCWDSDPDSRPEVPEVLQVLTLSVFERLINQLLATRERIRLITTIFSDNDQAKAVRRISCNNPQALIDVIDEVSPCTISPSKDKVMHLDSNLLVLLVRHWMSLHQRHAGGVCAICTRFVAIKPSFRDH